MARPPAPQSPTHALGRPPQAPVRQAGIDKTPHRQGPSAEAMAAAADIYTRNCTGVLLSGMGDDGREGMRAIAEAGGATLAQDEESSVVFDMPSAAIDAGVVHKALPLWNITDYILKGASANANAA